MTTLSRDMNKTPRVNMKQDVSRIRARFAEALKLGHSKEEAARLAQGDFEILPIGAGAAGSDKPASIMSPPEMRSESAPTSQTVTIAGNAKPERAERVRLPPDEIKKVLIGNSQISLDDIPPNWEDLPWPQLKALVAQLAPRITATNREVAIKTIAKALKKATAS